MTNDNASPEVPSPSAANTSGAPAGQSRRDVLRAASAATALAATSSLASAGGQESDATKILKVGLIGCGGRGSGAATNALRADPNVKLIAMGDVFEDQLEKALTNLKNVEDIKDQIDVPPENRIIGFDCHEKITDMCDVVLFASTPHFRPAQVEYAVKAGKHMFVEKPVAVDAPGLRRIWQACNDAKDMGIAVVTGLCYRYENKKRATIQKIREGAIGEIKALECSYDTGALWYREPGPDWTEMEHQVRNWLYYSWCSGDHVAEQAIHNLDKMIWAMDDKPPISVKAQGGRIVRTDPKFGNVFDHFSAVFDFDNNVKAFFSCRQWAGAVRDVSDHIYGTKGTAHLMTHKIEGENPWRWRTPEGMNDNMYQNEHDQMFASIRAGKPIHNGDIMCRATLLALMVRMSAYSGQEISWNQALESKEDLTPAKYEWGPNAVTPVAQPGITPFV
ncbi:MAG: putative dehydrogenase [Planctomycetota bacterium]|jgi:predicted dehydrogenase